MPSVRPINAPWNSCVLRDWTPPSIERFFALLEDKLGDKGGTSIISTHPGTSERRKAILDYNASLDNKPAAN